MRLAIGILATFVLAVALVFTWRDISDQAEPIVALDNGQVHSSIRSDEDRVDQFEGKGPQGGATVDSFMSDIAPPDFEVRILEPVRTVGATWNETYSLLAQDVVDGDSSAQVTLVISARKCMDGPRTREELSEYVSLAPKSGMNAQGHFIRNEDARAFREAVASDVLDYCANSRLEDLEQFPKWLEAAAEAGNPWAMLNYGIGYPGDEELDPSIAEDKQIIDERTARYVEYLEEASKRGSIDAMMKLSSIYLSKGTLEYQKASFANLYAYAWYRHKYEDSNGSFKYLRRIGYGMGPRDYYEAVEMGRELLSAPSCCFKVPEIQ